MSLKATDALVWDRLFRGCDGQAGVTSEGHRARSNGGCDVSL